jgi:hypothetical protein
MAKSYLLYLYETVSLKLSIFYTIISFFRLQNQNITSVIYILLIYYLEAAHISVLIICIPFIYFDLVGPFPFFLAQMVFILAWSAGDVMFILGSSISLVKILYVTNFDFIFNQNQELTARIILCLSLVVSFIPHLFIGIHRSISGRHIVPAAAYFMGEKIVFNNSPTPTLLYGSIWGILSGIMLVFAMLFIRIYEKKKHLLHASIVAGERCRRAEKSVSLIKVLLGVLAVTAALTIGILSQMYGLIDQFPAQLLFFSTVICILLVFFACEMNIWNHSRKQIFDKLAALKFVLRTKFRCRPGTVSPA